MSENIKTDKESQEPKVGVYVCHCGGNISNTVNVEKVVAAAQKMGGVAIAKQNMFMCSDPGQDMIINDIKEGNINRVVVAACAPSLHEITFRNAILRTGLNPYLYVHANIREQVSFVHSGEEATEKAIAIVAAAVAKVQEISPLLETSVDVIAHATVVGGGIAGMKAALDMANRGLKVSLIEKTPFLGGHSANLNRLFPSNEDIGGILSYLAEKLTDHPSVEIHTCAEITHQDGYVGNFKLTVDRVPPAQEDILAKIDIAAEKGTGKGEYIPFVGILPCSPPEGREQFGIETGAIVIATGFSDYKPGKGEYGYIDNPEVITLRDLIRILAEGEGSGNYLEVNGKQIKSMAMIHCVGSRQVKGIHEPDENGRINENCSRTCCAGLLHSAIEIKDRHPDTAIFNIYRDIRTYGRGHEELYAEACSRDIRLVRFKVENQPVVKRNDNGYALSVYAADSMMEDLELEIPVDLVVLATGMCPGEIEPLIDLLKIHCGADGFLLEVHPKLRPVEVFTAGIYLAGTCQAPMDITEATAAASAAASKTSILLSRGKVNLEPFISTVDPEKCAKCLTCVRACPFDVPVIEEEGAYINPAACYGCGVCVSVCPGNAISLAHYDNREISAQVKGAITSGIIDAENNDVITGG